MLSEGVTIGVGCTIWIGVSFWASAGPPTESAATADNNTALIPKNVFMVTSIKERHHASACGPERSTQKQYLRSASRTAMFMAYPTNASTTSTANTGAICIDCW